jgi:hypothetical protein
MLNLGRGSDQRFRCAEEEGRSLKNGNREVLPLRHYRYWLHSRTIDAQLSQTRPMHSLVLITPLKCSVQPACPYWNGFSAGLALIIARVLWKRCTRLPRENPSQGSGEGVQDLERCYL